MFAPVGSMRVTLYVIGLMKGKMSLQFVLFKHTTDSKVIDEFQTSKGPNKPKPM